MMALLEGLQAVLAVFVQPDIIGPPPPRWYGLLTIQMAHMLLGGAFAVYRAPR